MSDGDYSWVGPVMQAAVGLFGEHEASKLSDKQLKLLERQLNDVRAVGLPTLESLQADELGPSEVGQMRSDETMRAKQLRAMAQIQDAINQGGLDLSDQAALEEAMGAATNQQKRARAGVAADAAARGQLNSGNRLMMDLDAAQKGANDARQTGLQTAAMAQRRKLQMIQDSARMAGDMRENDWRENEATARARDIRDERNAAAREKAKYYNAGIPQQNFNNAMSKATGQQPAANAYGGGLGAAAADTRAAAAGMSNVIGAASNGGAYTYSTEKDKK